jgi:hypothetical protein
MITVGARVIEWKFAVSTAKYFELAREAVLLGPSSV